MLKKLLNEKNCFKWDLNLHTSTCICGMNSYCATTYTTTQNHSNESTTGHKKLKKLDNVKIGNLKKEE